MNNQLKFINLIFYIFNCFSLMDLVLLILVGFIPNFVLTLLPYTWHFIFIVFNIIGFKFYMITSDSKIKFLDEKVYYCSYYTNKPNGLIVGKWFIGCKTSKGGKHSSSAVVWCLSTKKLYVDIYNISDMYISKLHRVVGDIYEFNINSIEFKQIFVCYDWQKNICTKIQDKYEENKYCSILLSGISGCGKSSISRILAHKLNGSILRFNPSRYQLDSILNQLDYSETHPLIILIDEFDSYIKHGFKEDISKHIIPQWIDKGSYNSFFDDYEMAVDPNIIIICTSNTSICELEQIDASLVRNGRFGIKHHQSTIQ